MPKMAYRIRNWETLFETAESKKRQRLTWVAVPTKHDGKGYRRLMREHGPAVYGAWILIVAVAAKCPIRGTLADDDGPLTADDISDKTDCPIEIIERALEAVLDERVGWIEQIEHDRKQQQDSKSAGGPADDAGGPADDAGGPVLQYRTLPDITKPVPVSETGVSTKRGSRKKAPAVFPSSEPAPAGESPKFSEGQSVFGKLNVKTLSESLSLSRWVVWQNEQEAPVVGTSEMDVLNVFGAAERALAVCAKHGGNPVALFASIVSQHSWHLITQKQEESARKRIVELRREEAES